MQGLEGSAKRKVGKVEDRVDGWVVDSEKFSFIDEYGPSIGRTRANSVDSEKAVDVISEDKVKDIQGEGWVLIEKGILGFFEALRRDSKIADIFIGKSFGDSIWIVLKWLVNLYSFIIEINSTMENNDEKIVDKEELTPVELCNDKLTKQR